MMYCITSKTVDVNTHYFLLRSPQIRSAQHVITLSRNMPSSLCRQTLGPATVYITILCACSVELSTDEEIV